MVVVEAGKPERKLEFMPTGRAKSFRANNPDLGEGRNEIRWKALSKDGHPVSGSIIVAVKPGAAPSSPRPAATHPRH
jgi:methionine-rich copper-binding protein CopC